MHIGLIVIGDEILSGKRQDKHLARTLEMLAQRGMALSCARYVGDDRDRITQALRDAIASGDGVRRLRYRLPQGARSEPWPAVWTPGSG